jgi:hypothetical protein
MTEMSALSCGGAGLGRDSKAAGRSAKHEFFRHFPLGRINEILTAAMHRHDVFEINQSPPQIL